MNLFTWIKRIFQKLPDPDNTGPIIGPVPLPKYSINEHIWFKYKNRAMTAYIKEIRNYSYEAGWVYLCYREWSTHPAGIVASECDLSKMHLRIISVFEA